MLQIIMSHRHKKPRLVLRRLSIVQHNFTVNEFLKSDFSHLEGQTLCTVRQKLGFLFHINCSIVLIEVIIQVAIQLTTCFSFPIQTVKFFNFLYLFSIFQCNMTDCHELLFGDRSERLNFALKLFDKTREDLEQDVQIMKQWVKTQPHLSEMPRK